LKWILSQTSLVKKFVPKMGEWLGKMLHITRPDLEKWVAYFDIFLGYFAKLPRPLFFH
jgi:hypothetical protein